MTFLSCPLPDHQPKPEYIGKSFDTITAIHKEYKIIPYMKYDAETSLLEVRLENSTLGCIMKDSICIEAYLFEN